MGIISRTVSLYYTYKFIRILVTPWEKLPAFKLGLVDKDGNKLRSPETSEEKDEYTFFHRLAFNIKRTINKVPMGKSMFASLATAIYLLKENYDIDENEVMMAIKEEYSINDSNYAILTEAYIKLEDAPVNSTGPAIQITDTPLTLARRKKKEEKLRSYKEWAKAVSNSKR